MTKPSITEQIGENEILKMIKENQPISIHALYKKSSYGSYSGIWACVQRLEKKGLVIVEKVKIDKYVKMVKVKENE